jgi:hypothetical protein
MDVWGDFSFPSDVAEPPSGAPLGFGSSSKRTAAPRAESETMVFGGGFGIDASDPSDWAPVFMNVPAMLTLPQAPSSRADPMRVDSEFWINEPPAQAQPQQQGRALSAPFSKRFDAYKVPLAPMPTTLTALPSLQAAPATSTSVRRVPSQEQLILQDEDILSIFSVFPAGSTDPDISFDELTLAERPLIYTTEGVLSNSNSNSGTNISAYLDSLIAKPAPAAPALADASDAHMDILVKKEDADAKPAHVSLPKKQKKVR